MLSSYELVTALEGTLEEGFSAARVSKCALELYQNHGLELTFKMDHVLLTLMAMDEGKAFELSESEFLTLLEDLRNM